LGTIIGFADTEEKICKAIYEVITIQRDYGNRSDRKQARLKYTLDKYGVAWYTQELEKRTGFALEPARPYYFTDRGDLFGWQQNEQEQWCYTVFVENGRVVDDEKQALKTGLLELAKTGKANFRFTCNQNLILSDIDEKDKEAVNELLEKFGIIKHTEGQSLIRKNSMACVALPTCPLALAEAQRYLPSLIDKIEVLLDKYAIKEDGMIIRMTGCPNGCARSTAAEIGFIGTAPGRYNLQLGGDRIGERLNKLYRENSNEAEILDSLDPLFKSYSAERLAGETFGDFALRKKWVTT